LSITSSSSLWLQGSVSLGARSSSQTFGTDASVNCSLVALIIYNVPWFKRLSRSLAISRFASRSTSRMGAAAGPMYALGRDLFRRRQNPARNPIRLSRCSITQCPSVADAFRHAPLVTSERDEVHNDLDFLVGLEFEFRFVDLTGFDQTRTSRLLDFQTWISKPGLLVTDESYNNRLWPDPKLSSYEQRGRLKIPRGPADRPND
jgi:hypothetical protein